MKEKFLSNIFSINKMEDLKDRCFWCLDVTKGENSSKEHIFPKWLLKKMNIFDLELLSLDTKMDKLKVKCCKQCNNNYLNKSENELKKYYEDNEENLDKKLVKTWLSKILLGIAYFKITRSKNFEDFNKLKIMWAGAQCEANEFYSLEIHSFPLEKEHFGFFSEFCNFGSIIVAIGTMQISLILFDAPIYEKEYPKKNNMTYIDMLAYNALRWNYSFNMYGDVKFFQNNFGWIEKKEPNKLEWLNKSNKTFSSILKILEIEEHAEIEVKDKKIVYPL